MAKCVISYPVNYTIQVIREIERPETDAQLRSVVDAGWFVAADIAEDFFQKKATPSDPALAVSLMDVSRDPVFVFDERGEIKTSDD